MKKLILITCITIGLYSCKKNEDTVPVNNTNTTSTNGVSIIPGLYRDFSALSPSANQLSEIKLTGNQYSMINMDYWSSTNNSEIPFSVNSSIIMVDSDFKYGKGTNHIKGHGTVYKDSIVMYLTNDVNPMFGGSGLVKHRYTKQ